MSKTNGKNCRSHIVGQLTIKVFSCRCLCAMILRLYNEAKQNKNN